MDNLTKWLKENCTIKESQSTESKYYDFNEIKIRVSRHFTINNNCDIQVIKSVENQYICFTKDYKFPCIFKTSKEALCFVKSYLTYCQNFDHINNKANVNLKFIILKKLNTFDLSKKLNAYLICFIETCCYSKLEKFYKRIEPIKHHPEETIRKYFNLPLV